MTTKEKAEAKLNCFYTARNLMGLDGRASYSIEGKKEESSTGIVLAEAKKIWEWVSSKKES